MNGLTGNNLPIRKADVISLCFICDENYVMPAVVAITSVMVNKNSKDFYSIYIVANGLSDASLVVLQNLEDERFRIHIIKFTDDEKYNIYKISNLWITPTALFKFDLPAILPADLEKVLYLDVDIIAQKDLAEIFNQDIEDVYAGVIKDYAIVRQEDFRSRLNVKHKAYFNSGVLLLNLNKMREEHVSELLWEYRKTHKNKYMDQDSFNAVFRENVRYLPFYYNFQYSCLRFDQKGLTEYYGLDTVNSKFEWIPNAVIIHFTWRKPWKYFDIFAADIWLHYYLLSLFKEVPLVRISVNEELNDETKKELAAVKKMVASQKEEIESLKKHRGKAQRLARELNNVKTGWSFKIGRIITYVPRKIRDMFKKQY